MWRDLWTYRKKAVVAATLVLTALLAVAAVLATMFGGKGGRPGSLATPSSTVTGRTSASASATGYDHTPWNAAPTVAPAASGAYPPIPAEKRSQPDLFVQAFGTELLTRDYRHSTRAQLLAWAQGESAPLTIQQVPLSDSDRSKALIVSLTDPAWDNTPTSVVAPQGQWLSLRAQQGYTTVSGVKVEPVPDFPPADTTFTEPTLDRLYTATLALHTTVSGKPVTSRTSIAFEVVITDHLGTFGASETQHYVSKDLP
jgi:hypothetical protein